MNTEALKAGIEMRRASIDDIRILFKDIEADAYFNCTGLGSYHLKGVEDKSLYPTKVRLLDQHLRGDAFHIDRKFSGSSHVG